MRLFVVILANIFLICFLSGCCKAETIPVVVPVYSLPFNKDELPKVTIEEANTIREDIYLKLVKRDETLLQHIKLQQEIILKHNGN